MLNWITLYPQWFIAERNAIARSYPRFQIDEHLLQRGILRYYGVLVVRPSSGTKHYNVQLTYPAGTPFELPIVTPVEALPNFDATGGVEKHPKAIFFNRRHQMAGGALCLFQKATRGAEGGEWVSAIDVLKRAEEWLLGLHTSHWPPDSRESELESHFFYAGDVLLSKSFYSDDIDKSGRFFMVRDMRRIFDRVSDAEAPLIVTAITNKQNGVEAIYDARTDLENIYPWLGNDAWSPDQLAKLEEDRKKDEFLQLVAEHGYWWSLPREPLPFQTGADLLEELKKVAPDSDSWKMVSETIGTDLLAQSRHFVGLKYPDRTGEPQWLVLGVTGKPKESPTGGILMASEENKQQEFANSTVACYKVHGATPAQIQLRNMSVVATKVRDKTVTLIGLGALGSKIAELLAQAGVGTFRLCDMDHLSTGNVARHIGGLTDFGAKKSRVVMSRLFNINPHLEISKIIHQSAVFSLDDLTEFIEPADIVISTTADENVESAINQIAVIQNKPVVYGRALRRGSMGRIFLVRPEIDACKMCLGLYAKDARTGQSTPKDWIEVTERDEDILLHECGRPVIPASAIDLSFIASLAARVSLDFLEQGKSKENHWLWSREIATDVDSRFSSPLLTTSGSLPPHIDCCTCQQPEIIGVTLSEVVQADIVKEVETLALVETGGILLGFVDDQQKAVVVRATGPGPRAKKTATRFERDVEFVQAELDRAAEKFGRRGLYIGEWHSHLEIDPQPSGRDIMSMCGIAEAPNYATRCPIMLIAGTDPETGKMTKLKAWAFPVSGRVYPTELNVLPFNEIE